MFEKRVLGFLCDLPKWDEIDRLQIMANAITAQDFTSDEIAQILKHWGSNIFRRLYASDHQNRCIILKGNQGLGKDSWVKAMLKSFHPYYESTTFPGTAKDALEIASRLLVVHIEEFEQTAHLDIAFLKALITQPSSFFRESYGSSPNQKLMRPSFITTSNSDDILRDPTGNRRFIVIPIEGIKWTYPQNESPQIMAQFRAIYEAKEFDSLSHEVEAKIKTLIDFYTPDGIEGFICAIYEDKFDRMTRAGEGSGVPYPAASFLTYNQCAEMLGDIAQKAKVSMRKVQSTIKGKGYTSRQSTGPIYFGKVLFASQHKDMLKN
jgi:predicted P-loop ATPase